MERRLGTRFVRQVVAVVAVAALATSCAGDQEDAGPEQGSPTSDAAPPTSEPEGDSGSPSPTEPPETTAPADPSVTPATGKLVTTQRLTLRVPRGWQATRISNEGFTGVNPQAPSDRFAFHDSALPAPGGLTLDQLRRTSGEASGRPLKQDNGTVEYLGQDWYHQSGSLGVIQLIDEFGTYYEATPVDAAFTLTFILGEYLGAKERRRIIESVMATIELR